MLTTDETKLVEAHRAGRAYWRNNRPHDATREGLESHARSCGWHGELTAAWLAGFYGERKRDTVAWWRMARHNPST